MSEDAENTKITKKKRSTAKGKFHRIYGRLLEGIQEEIDIAVIIKILQDLESAYVELEARHETYLETFESDNEDDKTKVNELNHDITVMYKELCKSRSLCEDMKERVKAERASEKKSHYNEKGQTKGAFETFAGNIRQYPSFKVDYERHMLPSYGCDSYALKQCLSGDALRVVKGVDNDFEEMFRRLDLKYGRPEKLADNILSEIKGLKNIPEGDHMKFISMVETVETCWLDLKRMKLESEMNTATMISQIEKLLPPLQKREWALRKQRFQLKTRTGFHDFLQFLLEEKNVIEYMQDDMRECGNSRGKAHSVITTINQDDEKDGIVNTLQMQMQENQNMMKQVVEGLTHVAQMVSHSNNRTSFNRCGQDRSSSNNRGFERMKCWYHKSDAHEIGDCSIFAKLDIQTKIDMLRKTGGCFSCLKIGHLSRQCNKRMPCDISDNGYQRCGRMHHRSLHTAHVDGISFHNSAQIINNDKANDGVLLMISSVSCKGHSLTTIWDPGANMSLITHKAARKLGLSGQEITLSVTKVGNVTECVQSKEYILPLTDLSGNTWTIKAYGMEEVTADISDVDISKVARLFKGIDKKDVKRPTGQVDILIGTDCCILMPNKLDEVDNLQLMRNQFGYCLRGSHPLLGVPKVANHGIVKIYFVSGQLAQLNATHVVDRSGIKERLDSFFDIEGLGTQCALKCGSCKCGKCAIGQSNHSLREERELNIIKSGFKHDKESKQWTVQYPWIKNPNQLTNNVASAIARLLSTEKRLIRNGLEYAIAYNEQIIDMINRGIAKKLTKKEMEEHKGPVQYIPHHEVLKPESNSTPVRIVFNSSASFMGHVLNDYWAKGSNIMNALIAVLIRFRQKHTALAGDISKMYNAVKLSTLDQHTHRFVWRNLETHREPDHYVLMAVAFGDRPSGAIATLALRQTATMYQHIYPDASKMVIRNSYVDDILQSVDNVEEARRIAQETETMLAFGGFSIKHWIISGTETGYKGIVNTNMKLAESGPEKILGMRWIPKSDMFEFQVKINFSPKHRNIRTDKNIARNQIDCSVPELLTPRMVLSQVSSIYDPLGLATPFTLAAKVLMRKLCTLRLTDDKTKKWDCPLSTELRIEWVNFFKELFGLENLRFQRCVQPENAIGDPMLVVFSDGSKIAYGACAYVRWQVGMDNFKSRLVIAKNRIAPIKQLSVPRLELCGAVLAARLREILENEMDYTFCRVIHIVDSTIVRAQIQRESYGFGTFVATRIAEIQNKTEPSEWWRVPTDKNAADLTTRITSPRDLEMNSIWQNGPQFLRYPIENWPIRQDSNVESSQLPDTIGVAMASDIKVVTEANSILNFEDINLENISKFSKLLRVTCILMQIAKAKSFKNVTRNITAEDLVSAELEWIRVLQREITNDWRRNYQRLGSEMNEQGIIVVGKRLTEWMKNTWNRTEIVLLPNKGRFVWLYIQSVHEHDHAGIDVTLAKVRRKFWIPGIRRTVKLIKRQCIVCRRRNEKCVGQEMGPLPLERMQPSPAFSYCSVDLFGPFTIKDTVKGRTHGKAYGVLFNCMSSRAVYVDLAEGYDTSSFIMVLRRFVSMRGYPKKIRSDAGSQLVAASKELNTMAQSWNWDAIKMFGKDNGMEWEITKSADAPWENGCSESFN